MSIYTYTSRTRPDHHTRIISLFGPDAEAGTGREAGGREGRMGLVYGGRVGRWHPSSSSKWVGDAVSRPPGPLKPAAGPSPGSVSGDNILTSS